MSFGVGVGDFLAVGRLVLDLYNACKDAPGEFQEICRELSSIHTVLSGLAEQAKDPNSLFIKQGKERIPEWTQIQENLEFTLGELQDLVKRYYKMGRNAWMRIQFVNENLSNLRGRLSFHLNVINTFVSSLSLSALGRMEPALGRIELLLRESIREERAGNKEPTLMSAYENNDAMSWEKIEMDLALEGVSKMEFEKNKDRIKELLDWVVNHGADLAGLSEVGMGDSVSQRASVDGKVAANGAESEGKVTTITQFTVPQYWRNKAILRRGNRGKLTSQQREDQKKRSTPSSGFRRMRSKLFSESPPEHRKYTYRAKSIESYDAPSNHPNQLSFARDEMLEVRPTAGGWWPARNEKGDRGVVASDSFVLLSEISSDAPNTPTPTFFSRWRKPPEDDNHNQEYEFLYPVFYYGTTSHRAKALEPYIAPSWCSNDLSFQRDEELELSTRSGLWWLARNEEGETGIVPADHLVPL